MNRSFSKIRHIQEANQKLEQRLLNENKSELHQINEDILSSFNTGMSKFAKDPKVVSVLSKILQCAMNQPLKAVDYLRAITSLVVLFFGEPEQSSEASFEDFNASRARMEKQLGSLINPCKNVTVEEIKELANNKEFQRFFTDLKNKFQ